MKDPSLLKDRIATLIDSIRQNWHFPILSHKIASNGDCEKTNNIIHYTLFNYIIHYTITWYIIHYTLYITQWHYTSTHLEAHDWKDDHGREYWRHAVGEGDYQGILSLSLAFQFLVSLIELFSDFDDKNHFLCFAASTNLQRMCNSAIIQMAVFV